MRQATQRWRANEKNYSGLRAHSRSRKNKSCIYVARYFLLPHIYIHTSDATRVTNIVKAIALGEQTVDAGSFIRQIGVNSILRTGPQCRQRDRWWFLLSLSKYPWTASLKRNTSPRTFAAKILRSCENNDTRMLIRHASPSPASRRLEVSIVTRHWPVRNGLQPRRVLRTLERPTDPSESARRAEPEKKSLALTYLALLRINRDRLAQRTEKTQRNFGRLYFSINFEMRALPRPPPRSLGDSFDTKIYRTKKALETLFLSTILSRRETTWASPAVFFFAFARRGAIVNSEITSGSAHSRPP